MAIRTIKRLRAVLMKERLSLEERMFKLRGRARAVGLKYGRGQTRSDADRATLCGIQQLLRELEIQLDIVSSITSLIEPQPKRQRRHA